jgi:undecaprenyl-diphosphatase
MFFLKIAFLAVIQGFAELLPVSSSAHVIVAEKLMGLDPTQPKMTLLLVLLHTATMGSVLVYFGGKWKNRYFQSSEKAGAFLKRVLLATFATGLLGIALKFVIEKMILRDSPKAEVETLFGNLSLIAGALAASGFLILAASSRKNKKPKASLGPMESLWIGLVQGLCLPFRGFSRSGSTISTGLLLGLDRILCEDFSFALGVLLTPPVLLQEAHRLWKSQSLPNLTPLIAPRLGAMAVSFLAGLLALRWLSDWLEQGRWNYFGFYCLAASAVVFALHLGGF